MTFFLSTDSAFDFINRNHFENIKKTNIYESLRLTTLYSGENLVISQLNISLRKLTVSKPGLIFIGEISLAKETSLRFSLFPLMRLFCGWLAIDYEMAYTSVN